MSDEEISRDPETRGSKARSSTDSSFSPKDAVALFFQIIRFSFGKAQTNFSLRLM